MARKAFDQIASGVGAMLVVVLLVAGGLMLWGSSYADSNVHDQLARQEISFPPAAGLQGTTVPMSYAGKQVVTGTAARVYALDFIGSHLKEQPLGGIYSRISSALRSPNLSSQRKSDLTAAQQTSFQGTTLQGMLLQAYAFGSIGTVMMWGAIASFVLAILMAILVVFGVMHASRTSAEEQVFSGGSASASAGSGGAVPA